jgi:uncharacterized membrane protein YhaH (DUF805 family)
MNKNSFWAGVGMLTIPVFIYGIILFVQAIIESGITGESLLMGFLIVCYVVTAIYLIIRGLTEKEVIYGEYPKFSKGGK